MACCARAGEGAAAAAQRSCDVQVFVHADIATDKLCSQTSAGVGDEASAAAALAEDTGATASHTGNAEVAVALTIDPIATREINALDAYAIVAGRYEAVVGSPFGIHGGDDVGRRGSDSGGGHM